MDRGAWSALHPKVTRVRHDGRDLHAHIEVGENQLNHQKGAPREKVHRPTTEVSAAFHLPGTLSLSNSKL